MSKVISAVAIGKLIEYHKEGNDEKFDEWANFILEAYEEAGNTTAANLIRNKINGVKTAEVSLD